MEPYDLRILCAKEAMNYIQDKSIIGLGAGRNIEILINIIGIEMKNGLKIRVVTPSLHTRTLCFEKGIEVVDTYLVDEIDVAFDGCGAVDKSLYASKGGGGIYTKEKLIASMAKEYILLLDETKLTDALIPEVSLEVIKDSLSYVKKSIKNAGGVPTVRSSCIKDSYTITDDGNFLIDVLFSTVKDLKELNDYLNSIHGVIATSLFTREVTKLIIAGEKGVRVVAKA
jgi:ribose 5-phosphate isomerase A